MEAVKDPVRVKRMFAEGEVSMVDPVSKYRYSLVAKCPKDGGDAYVDRFDKAGHSLSRVVFQCGTCLNQFEAQVDDVMVI